MKRVFGLIDPQTDRIIYVGTTTTDYTADEWVAFLIRINKDKEPPGALKRLLQTGPRPNAVLLEHTDDPNVKSRWIDFLTNTGHQLIDSMGRSLPG